MKQTKAAGTKRELQVVKLMRDFGYVAFRTPASMGVCDVIAIRDSRFGKGWHWEVVLPATPIKEVTAHVCLIEVKANHGSPYKNFLGSDREALRLAAKAAGATAWLYHWPPNGTLREIPSSEWPEQPWADSEEIAA